MFSRVCLFVAFFIGLIPNAFAGIEYQIVEAGTVNVKSGIATPFRRLINCDPGGTRGDGSAFASHGKVTYKETTAKHACGQETTPALLVIYTSDPGFTGIDDITVYSGRAPFHFKMVVH